MTQTGTMPRSKPPSFERNCNFGDACSSTEQGAKKALKSAALTSSPHSESGLGPLAPARRWNVRRRISVPVPGSHSSPRAVSFAKGQRCGRDFLITTPRSADPSPPMHRPPCVLSHRSQSA